MLNIQFIQAQEEAEARDLGIGLLRSPDELSDGEKGNVESPTKFWRVDGYIQYFCCFFLWSYCNGYYVYFSRVGY